jgi:N-acetylmuramic acid 6-phosphate etherase
VSQPPEDSLQTEARNPASERIDSLDAAGIVTLMAAEDARALDAVRAERRSIARAIDRVAEAFRNGGRLIYVGAGTSGRLGVLDASECPPTFGTDPGLVVGVIAGGDRALRHSVEDAEDRPESGAEAIDALMVTAADVVVGIATSGRTPFVLGAMDRARERGSTTIGLACNRPSLLEEHVELLIAPVVGPEVIAGSTRLKAGTATKLVLNMISTGAMVRIGKTYGNRMIDLGPLNEKLRRRSRRIVREVASVSDDEARRLLNEAGGRLKLALVMALAGVSAEGAARLLNQHSGQVREALAAAGGSQQ